MASYSARRAARRWALGMVVPLVFVAACGRSGDMRVAEGGEGGGGVAVQPTGADPGAQGTGAPGDFGDLKGLCGPRPADFQPTGKQVRGVTDTEIKVTTMGDPGNQIQPGLGQEFFDIADAFTKWCNDAGGINGRKISVTKRDGMLTQAATKITEACQTDFMHVGGGNPLDNTTVGPRLGCKLGAVPAYVVTTEALKAPLQVQPGGTTADEGIVGPLKALFEKFPEAKDKVGVLGQNLGALGAIADRYEASVEKAGGTVVSKQLAAPMGQEWRTIVESMKAADVKILFSAGAFSINATPFVQEMNNSGWEPLAVVSEMSSYNHFNIQTAKDADMPPFYIYTPFWPQELADRKPAAKLAVDLLHTKDKDARLEYFHYSGLNAWLLWAAAVRDCGADLTVDCVLEKAQRTGWTAGGLFAPSDPATPDKMTNTRCYTMLKLDPAKGVFDYDEETTKPDTDTIFSCSPDNVVKLDRTYS
ncbi:ABC transporter substrate-binding protein [Yinghuangia sp. ASG 101]|uniref:ABC transporter substrate-binding protein n=1 Tax=Yinghuangia sp. ASG 101 TaxID=2896848 RepID=UPI001E639046|nr:ABC transporter substrate-binding protein [Yinghuangia sp. ASG 101]UGQ13311.1 ABC transporter substrate-binding protein [Yinghuangia sp. ASG 101]